MKTPSIVVVVVAVIAMAMSGCYPESLPAYVEDGKAVVAITTSNNDRALFKYDIESGKTTLQKLPEGWSLDESRIARIIGGRICITFFRLVDDGDKKCEQKGMWFDPTKGTFSDCPFKPDEYVFEGSYDGKKCVFAELRNEHKYKVWSFPDLKPMKDVETDGVISPAGGFWWTKAVFKLKSIESPGDIEKVELYNSEAKRVCTISQEELAKMPTEGHGWYSQVSDDGKTILLAFGGQRCWHFGMFDASTGKYLWGGKDRDIVEGRPIVKADEVWTIKAEGMATSAPSGANTKLSVMRYSREKGEKQDKAKAEKVLTYETTSTELQDMSSFNGVAFNPSPDRSSFVMLIDGKPERLIFFPAKLGATDKDVKVVELKK